MVALRSFNASLIAWIQYAYGLGALSALLVPRASRWGRRWMRSRLDQRMLLARAVGATTQVS